MPEWVLVGENDLGDTVVVCDWTIGLVREPVADAKANPSRIAVFRSRWDAKRVLRKRNEWRNLRCVRRDKL